MPKIKEHLGLSFYIYLQDHLPPHVHVIYGDNQLKINIETGEVISGYLPPKKRKLACKIIAENKELFIREFIKHSK